MNCNNLFVVSAPSGAGKTSLVKALLEKLDDLCLSVSYTTRPKRENETHAKNYYFTSVEEFTKMREQGGFIEHAEVFGNYYGTPKREIERMLNDGRDVLLEIDWQGAVQIQQHYPKAVMIFILPPDMKTLRARLEMRAADSSEVIDHRLKEAASEMRHYDRFDYLIVNEDFNKALEDLATIVYCHRLRRNDQQKNLKDLLAKLGLLPS